MPRTPRLGREQRLVQVMQAVIHHGATTQPEIAAHLGIRGVSLLLGSCLTRQWLVELPRAREGTRTPQQKGYAATDKGRAALGLRAPERAA